MIDRGRNLLGSLPMESTRPVISADAKPVRDPVPGPDDPVMEPRTDAQRRWNRQYLCPHNYLEPMAEASERANHDRLARRFPTQPLHPCFAPKAPERLETHVVTDPGHVTMSLSSPDQLRREAEAFFDKSLREPGVRAMLAPHRGVALED